MRALSVPSAVLLLVVGLAPALSGCDSGSDGPQVISFLGVDVEAVGGTELAVVNGRLVVSGVNADGDGVGFWEDYDRVSLEVAPIDLAAGEEFGTSFQDTDERFVAGIESRGRADGSHDIVFDIADRLGVQFVTLQYLLGGQIVVEIPRVPVGGGEGGGLKLRAETGAGTGDGRNGSTRVIRDGGRYVVGQDYSDDPAPLGPEAGGAATAKGECPFALVTLPPVAGDVFDVCVDLVQVVIDDEALPERIRGVAVTGRNLGSFEITELTVQGG